MLSNFFLPVAAVLGAVVSASPELYERNLVYRSPYVSHPALGIDTQAVTKRHLEASHLVRRDIAKRQAQAEKPAGEDDEYPAPGYGLGVTNWSNAGYIYAGDLNFTHGVASGDPFDYSVILWTRATPVGDYRIDIPQCVRYKVFEGTDGEGEPVSEGYALTGADVDFTVKVEATGLSASTLYSYRFENCAKSDNTSPLGKTRTAPGKYGKDVPTQRFAIYSCANYPNGFFSAYSGPVVYNDADYVVHLGDYIYEYGTGGASIGRVPSKGAELATLDDYRRRYDQYRLDPDLANMHQNIPIIAIWDDHETANNDWKAGSSDSNDSIATGGCAYSNDTVCFSDRAVNAKRAYFEWIPIRQVDLADQARIYRDFRFGDLLDIYALDTRKYDRDLTDLGYNTDYVQSLAVDLKSSRSIVGPQQEKWIEDGLQASQDRGTLWKLVMNQVIFGSTKPDSADFTINYDSWDGYQANRRQLLEYVYDNSIDNVVAFTGDTHANWLLENTLETTLQGTNETSTLKNLSSYSTDSPHLRGAIVEFGGTAVSSNGWGNSWGSYDNSTVGAQRMVDNNPQLLWTEGWYRGYMTVSVNYTHLETSWYGYPGNQQASVPNNRTLAMRATVEAGTNQIQRPLMTPVFGAIKGY